MARGTAASTTTEVHHPLFARWYPPLARRADAKGGAEHRCELLAGLAGRVVEVGAGDGLNFSRYPAEVSELIAVEPEPRLRRSAERAATMAPIRVRVVSGRAEALPENLADLDAAVLSLVLCSIPDIDTAMSELRRVLRPGAEVRFYEHVRSEGRWAAGAQQVADLVWPRLSGGCHLSRRSAEAIDGAGFEIVSSKRFRFLGVPHVIGVARLP